MDFKLIMNTNVQDEERIFAIAKPTVNCLINMGLTNEEVIHLIGRTLEFCRTNEQNEKKHEVLEKELKDIFKTFELNNTPIDVAMMASMNAFLTLLAKAGATEIMIQEILENILKCVKTLRLQLNI